MPPRRAHVRGLLLALVPASIAIYVSVAASPCAWAAAPEDAAIHQAIERGVHFLLNPPQAQAPIPLDIELGANCLAAIALRKCDVDANHPFIQRAANNLRAKLKSGEITGYTAVYNLGVGLVFLSVLKDKDTARVALKQLLTFQHDHGGFSPPAGSPLGDTSMTQYAVLGMWEAEQLGIAVPPQAWQRVATWLMETQAADGTSVYNPNRGLPTSEPHSMTVAALGSMYIIANAVRARGTAKKRDIGKTDGSKTAGKDGGKTDAEGEVPSALVPVGPKKEPGQDKAAQEKTAQDKAASGPITIDKGRLQAAASRGDEWLDSHFKAGLAQWPIYYLYAMERYQAFREKWEGAAYKESNWYSEGAAFLLSKQTGDGSWFGDYNHQVSTSFALLFLVRGTRKSLAAAPDEKASGTLLSGSGLPADLTSIRLKGGQIVVKPLAGPAGDMLDLMEKPDDPRFLAAVEGLADLVVKADDIMLSPHLVRLRKLTKSDSPEARAAAVAALGKSRDLDSVPTLIFALRDDDERVMRAAWDGLRFVSRRFDGFGALPDFKGPDFKGPDSKGNDRERALAKAKAIERWQQWYKTVRPDAEFEE